MRMTPWCLLPLHHSKDLAISTIVRARDRRKCAVAVAYRPAFVVGYGKVQLQLQGVRGEGRSSLIATTLPHTDLTKRLVWSACRNTFVPFGWSCKNLHRSRVHPISTCIWGHLSSHRQSVSWELCAWLHALSDYSYASNQVGINLTLN